MLICNNCGEVFDEPKIERETHGLDCPPYEAIAVCPHCEDTDICEAKKCERCGEYFAELDEGLCDVCYGDMYGE